MNLSWTGYILRCGVMNAVVAANHTIWNLLAPDALKLWSYPALWGNDLLHPFDVKLALDEVVIVLALTQCITKFLVLLMRNPMNLVLIPILVSHGHLLFGVVVF